MGHHRISCSSFRVLPSLTMKEIVAFMLARMGGNDNPTKEDVVEILDAVGIKADDGKLDALFADLDKLGVSVDEAIVSGTAKLAVVGTGGGHGDRGGVDKEIGSNDPSIVNKPDEDSDSESKSSSPGPGGGLFDVDNSDSD